MNRLVRNTVYQTIKSLNMFEIVMMKHDDCRINARLPALFMQPFGGKFVIKHDVFTAGSRITNRSII